jgi:hypothetical protein
MPGVIYGTVNSFIYDYNIESDKNFNESMKSVNINGKESRIAKWFLHNIGYQ